MGIKVLNTLNTNENLYQTKKKKTKINKSFKYKEKNVTPCDQKENQKDHPKDLRGSVNKA